MRVVAATANPGKLAELNAMLASHDWDIVAQSEFGVADVIETGLTFVENALLKARHACAHTGLAAIADDSGLEVDALDGAPGIRSARYAADVGANAADNLRKLLKNLATLQPAQRTARFRCVLVFMRNATDPCPLISVGTWEGRIAEVPAGDNGFGYDPVFFVDDLGKTAAQLQPSVKNRLSHRGKALRQLQSLLQPL